MIKVDGRPVGGIAGHPPMIPDGTPSFWNTYFSVADADAAVRAVEQGGSEVLVPVRPAPYGRQAVVRDNGGAGLVLVDASGGS
jgi:predicted enzyme related to lactoylglutathione lyase